MHPLTLTDTMMQPRLSHFMAGHTTRITFYFLTNAVFLNQRIFLLFILLSRLRMASNTVSKLLKVMAGM